MLGLGVVGTIAPEGGLVAQQAVASIALYPDPPLRRATARTASLGNALLANNSSKPFIAMKPADPQMIYPLEYDPAHIWRPPLCYPAASWYYPPFAGADHLDFGVGFPSGEYFGGGWSWQPSDNNIANNRTHGYNFNPSRNGGLNGRNEWSHDAWNHRSHPAWIGIQTIEETTPTFAVGSTIDGGYQAAKTETLVWIRFR